MPIVSGAFDFVKVGQTDVPMNEQVQEAQEGYEYFLHSQAREAVMARVGHILAGEVDVTHLSILDRDPKWISQMSLKSLREADRLYKIIDEGRPTLEEKQKRVQDVIEFLILAFVKGRSAGEVLDRLAKMHMRDDFVFGKDPRRALDLMIMLRESTDSFAVKNETTQWMVEALDVVGEAVHQQILNYLKSKAEEGDGHAQAHLALYFEKDAEAMDKAIHFASAFLKREVADYAHYMTLYEQIAQLLYDARDVSEETEQTLRDFLDMALAREDMALNPLFIYLKAHVIKEERLMVGYLLAAMEHGSHDAALELADYYHSHGPGYMLDTIYPYLEKRALEGHEASLEKIKTTMPHWANYLEAKFYIEGVRREKDYNKARVLLEKELGSNPGIEMWNKGNTLLVHLCNMMDDFRVFQIYFNAWIGNATQDQLIDLYNESLKNKSFLYWHPTILQMVAHKWAALNLEDMAFQSYYRVLMSGKQSSEQTIEALDYIFSHEDYLQNTYVFPHFYDKFEELVKNQFPRALYYRALKLMSEDYQGAVELLKIAAIQKDERALQGLQNNADDGNESGLIVLAQVNHAWRAGGEEVGWRDLDYLMRAINENSEAAYDILVKWADDENDSRAQYELAKFLMHGNEYFLVDYNKAYEYAVKSNENGSGYAIYLLGQCSLFGLGCEKDIDLGVEFLDLYAKEGPGKGLEDSYLAMYDLGMLYAHEDYFGGDYNHHAYMRKDPQLARTYFELILKEELGAPDEMKAKAHMELARLLFSQSDADDHLEEIKAHFTRSLELHPTDQAKLGLGLLLTEEETIEAKDRGYDLLFQAAQEGNGGAIKMMKEAKSYFKRRADNADLESMRKAAEIAYSGLNHESLESLKDFPLARSFYLILAQVESEHQAEYNFKLGEIYAHNLAGDVTFSPLIEAFRHYKRAADANPAHAQAAFKVGKMYLLGEGVAHDAAQAEVYLQKAVDLGLEDAKKFMAARKASDKSEGPR